MLDGQFAGGRGQQDVGSGRRLGGSEQRLGADDQRQWKEWSARLAIGGQLNWRFRAATWFFAGRMTRCARSDPRGNAGKRTALSPFSFFFQDSECARSKYVSNSAWGTTSGPNGMQTVRVDFLGSSYTKTIGYTITIRGTDIQDKTQMESKRDTDWSLHFALMPELEKIKIWASTFGTPCRDQDAHAPLLRGRRRKSRLYPQARQSHALAYSGPPLVVASV